MPQPVVTFPRVLKHLSVMCVVAAVLGVVVAGLAIPFAGLVGLGARDTANTLDKLPANFTVGSLAQTSRVLDAKGNLITTIYDQNRVYRPLDQISRKMAAAVVSIEDYRFYQHGALDLKGTLRAFITNEANSGVVQGGSSITQQLVKMTLLYKARGNKELQKQATEDSYSRKLRELRYAIALEQAHSKDWILEHYLNAAYFGDGSYGIQAAAKRYFGINASQLNWSQSALLAGLVKNPSGYDPTNFPDAAIARRNVVLDRMAQLHVISPQLADKLKSRKLNLHVTPTRNGCVSATAPFFCDYVVSWLLKDPALGNTVTERSQLLKSGGLTIKTTLDPRFQKAADNSVRHHVAPKDNAVGALAMVEPGTGAVRALAQSRPMGADRKKGQTYINYTVPTQYGNSAGFQAGSTFKLFVLASAIQQGVPLSQTYDAVHTMSIPEYKYANCPGAGHFVDTWHVSNSTIDGQMNMYTGTRESVNTYFAQLEQRTGVCAPYNLAKSMGIELTDPSHERVPPFTLGIASVSPLEMAEAYATVAARGKHCDSQPVTEIDDASGHVLKKYAPKCQQVMSQATADAVNDILKGVQEPGGFGGDAGLGLSVPSAAKTGTINDNMAVWYCGYTPKLSAASMIAGANSLGHWITLNGQSLAGGYVATAHGSTTAGPMWGDAMHAIQKYLPDVPFHAPDPSAVHGVQVSVPAVGGMSVAQATKVLKDAGFGVSVGGTDYSSYPFGTVAYSVPGSTAGSGSTVTLITSAGPAPAPPPPPPPVHHSGGGKKHGGNNHGPGHRRPHGH